MTMHDWPPDAAWTTVPSMRLLRALALKRRLENGHTDDGTPLCVGLDGALVRGRIMREAGLALLRARPLVFLQLLPLACRPALFKARLRELARLDPALLPFRRETLRFLREHHARGRMLVLVGADRNMVRAVAGHIGIFSQTLGDDENRDLTATGQARLLCAAFGPGGFDYVGAEWRDIPSWGTARRAVILSAQRRILKHPQWHHQAASIVTTQPRARHVWLDALRPSQWPRNLLIFMPLLVQDVLTVDRLILAYCGACACGLVAAASGMAADLFGPHGRPAPGGNARMMGGLRLEHALLLAAFLGTAGIAVALSISTTFAAWIAAYPLLVMAHVLWLRRATGIVAPASLDLHRLLAGNILIGLKPFSWQLGLAALLFLAFAAWRRHTATSAAVRLADARPRAGRSLAVPPLTRRAASAVTALLATAFFVITG